MGRVQAAEISRTRLSINRKYKAWKGRIETWPPIKLFHDLSCAFYTSKNVYRLTHIPSPFLASTCCVGDLFRSVSTSYLFSSRFLPMVTRLDFCFYKMSIKNLTTVTYTFPSMSRTISVRGKEFSIYVPQNSKILRIEVRSSVGKGETFNIYIFYCRRIFIQHEIEITRK